jgi:hypothetical protein
MYTWSLSENLTSVQFRCKLTALLLKRSLFKKHDFSVYLHKLYCDHQNLCFQQLRFFTTNKIVPQTQTKEQFKKSNQFQIDGGGKALISASDELLPYALTALHEPVCIFLTLKKYLVQN